MTVNYGKLWQMCVEHDIPPTFFSKDKNAAYYIEGTTFWRMRNNKPVSLQVVDKLCSFFKCQPCEIMEFELHLLERNVQTVDHHFEKIEKQMGSEAKNMLWDNLIKNVNYTTISEKYNYSISTIKRKMTSYHGQISAI